MRHTRLSRSSKRYHLGRRHRSRKSFTDQHFSFLTKMESTGWGGWGPSHLLARRIPRGDSELLFMVLPCKSGLSCSGDCDCGECFLSTPLSTSWNLASSMSQIRKLTPKLQIHLKVLAFHRAFSPGIDSGIHKKSGTEK